LLPGSFPVFDLLEQGEGEGKLLAQVGEVFEGCGWVATLVGGQGQVDPGAGKAGLFGNDVFQELAGGLGLALFEQAEGLLVALFGRRGGRLGGAGGGRHKQQEAERQESQAVQRMGGKAAGG